MAAQPTQTIATRIEALRERISRDAPEITRRIREAAAANQGNEARFRTLFAQIIESLSRGHKPSTSRCWPGRSAPSPQAGRTPRTTGW